MLIIKGCQAGMMMMHDVETRLVSVLKQSVPEASPASKLI